MIHEGKQALRIHTKVLYSKKNAYQSFNRFGVGCGLSVKNPKKYYFYHIYIIQSMIDTKIKCR